MKHLTSLCLFVALCADALAAGDNPVIPRNLHGFLKERGCEQVSDFFERPWVEGPPYALRSHDMRDPDFAVWCTNDRSKPEHLREYTLLVRVHEKGNPLGACPEAIKKQNFIGALSFFDITEKFEWYHFVDTKKQVAGEGELKTKAIITEYDGTGAQYVCIKGKWAMRVKD